MHIKQCLTIGDLCYVIQFRHAEFSFYLQAPQRRVRQINYKKNPHLALFRDDDVYEDLNLNLPAWQILMAISQQIQRMIVQYRIQYWYFSATSVRKALLYQHLLQRHLRCHPKQLRYDRDGLSFYVYMQNHPQD